MIRLVWRYVVPGRSRTKRYIHLLGNLFALSDRGVVRFGRKLARDARRISDHDLGVLLDGDWRSRLTAAWLIALDRRVGFRDRLSRLLLDSEFVYAGAGYCVALARFGEAEDAAVLSAYLDRYLPQVENRYDQEDALGALLLVDERLGTRHAGRFLTPGGLWETFTTDDVGADACRSDMRDRVSFAESAMNGTLAAWTAARPMRPRMPRLWLFDRFLGGGVAPTRFQRFVAAHPLGFGVITGAVIGGPLSVLTWAVVVVPVIFLVALAYYERLRQRHYGHYPADPAGRPR
ncbi:DUF6000 family protein [Herbidospora sp. RD11066]